jgi:predicted permease
VSSSKNCREVLDSVRLTDLFDPRVDGAASEDAGLKGKPDPDIFLEAARRLGASPERAVVVEDAISGVQAGRDGRFGLVVGVDRTGDAAEKAAIYHLLDARMMVIPAALLAVTLNLTQVKFPSFILRLHIIDILVFTSSFLTFFSIGLRFRLVRVRDYFRKYIPVLAIKFLITPAIAFGLLFLVSVFSINLTGLVGSVIIIQSFSPCGVMMVTMSNVFNLDGPLASAVWVASTVVYVVLVVPMLCLIFL